MEPKSDEARLDDLLNEIRILLPGSEIFLSLLATLPFTARFPSLTSEQVSLYASTFFTALLAFVCFVTPAAYHRIARPIRHKQRFKLFASRMLVLGLAPMSISLVLVTYLVTSVVGIRWGDVAAFVIGIVIACLWWLVPLLRLHDRFGPIRKSSKKEEAHGQV